MTEGMAHGRRRIQLAGAIVLGVVLVLLAAAAVTLLLIAPAWGVCGEDVGVTPGLVLLFDVLPRLFVFGVLAFLVGFGLARRVLRHGSLAVGLVLAAVALVLGMTFFVPILGEGSDFYQTRHEGATPSCGVQGIPTWWPSFLPH